MTNAKIIADSINPAGSRLTTFVVTYPRIIHAEACRHRNQSRNTASSRAIPAAKMIAAVHDDPFVPERWGAAAKGMQDGGEVSTEQAMILDSLWGAAGIRACEIADAMVGVGCHKQFINRLLEPFAWTTEIISASEWANFFRLRCHRDAQPEFQRLAHLMLLAYVASEPKALAWGEWHLPFDPNPTGVRMMHIRACTNPACPCHWPSIESRLVTATARCARVSYTNHDKATTFDEDKALHDRLVESGHWSPLEHCARADGRDDGAGNFDESWMQYRQTVAPAPPPFDPAAHLAAYEAEAR